MRRARLSRPSKISRKRNWKFEALETRQVLDGVIISEFLAVNDNGIADEDGDRSDWIEILNTDPVSVNLDGWHLTDRSSNLNKWTFPEVSIAPGATMLIWASAKDRAGQTGPLHTNFNLAASGEYLALVKPDLSIASQYTPQYPAQISNYSYGVPGTSVDTTLVASNATGKLLLPTDGTLGETWKESNFVDTAWQNAQVGVGYEVDVYTPPNVGCDVSTNVPAACLARSVQEFNRQQGLNNWRYGRWVKSTDADGVYNGTTEFAQFLWIGGTTPTASNHWNGTTATAPSYWDMAVAPARPNTELRNVSGMPEAQSTVGAAVHWTIRRWVAEKTAPMRIRGTITDLDAAGTGAVARIYINGTQVYSTPINNNTVNYELFAAVTSGQNIDFIIDAGPDNNDVGDNTGFTAFIDELPSLPPPELTDEITTNVQATMKNVTPSAYWRIPFNVADPSALDFLKLRMKYDAGFIAYINGVEVARSNAPGNQTFNSLAILERDDGDAIEATEFNLTSGLSAMVPGTNVLAIHGLNSNINDNDFLLAPELIGTSLTVDTNTQKYFPAPTPNLINGAGLTDVGPVVSGVTKNIVQPGDNDNIVITATVTPTVDALSTVTLNYKINYNADVPVPMFDDGLHGDGAAGDNVFGATIPASASTPGQMVRWYVRATDTGADTGRQPLALPSPGAPRYYEEYYGTVVRNPTQTVTMKPFYWFTSNAATANGGSTTRGSVFWDGEFYDNVEFSNHGQSSSGFPKHSFNVDFPEDHGFRWADGLERIDDINMITTYADKAKMRNSLAWYERSLAGDAYHLSEPVLIYQNPTGAAAATELGIWEMGEDASDEWTARLGLNREGAIFKMYNTFNAASGEYKTHGPGSPNGAARATAAAAELTAFYNGVHLADATAKKNFIFDNTNLAGMANFLAGYVIDGNTDCCHKNYYFYRDSGVTDEWWGFAWDEDLTNGRVWGGCGGLSYHDYTIYANQGVGSIGGNNDLMGALFGYPEFREIFMRRVRTLMDEVLQPLSTPYASRRLEAKVDAMEAMEAPHAAADFARFGQVSSANACQPAETHPVAVQKIRDQYLNARRTYLYTPRNYTIGGASIAMPDAQPANANLTFGTIEFTPTNGNQEQEFIEVRNTNTHSMDISGWTIEGDITHTFQPGTVVGANRSIYVARDAKQFRARTTGPRGGQQLYVQGNYDGHLSARGGTLTIKDKTGRIAANTTFAGSPSTLQQSLRVTEVMYNPQSPPLGSAYLTEDFQYVELQNIGAAPVSLTGVKFVEGVQFNFTGSAVTSLNPGEYVLIVKNQAAFASRYNTAGMRIAGEFTGNLDNAGERVLLQDTLNENILDFDYQDNWYNITDGTGFSLHTVAPATTLHNNWDQPGTWLPSRNLNGSPGSGDAFGLPAPGSIVVSEVLAASSGPEGDMIELRNTTASAINIGAWFLSDDGATASLTKYRIPVGTILPANGFLVFNQRDHFGPVANPGSGFAYSSTGDEAVLTAGEVGNPLPLGYQARRNFKGSDPNVTFGRHVNSTLDEHFVAMTASTFGSGNAQPVVGPVVINEIFYNPPAGGLEYVELKNISNAPVPLFDPANPTNTWQITDGVIFLFPTNITLAPGELIVVTEGDPAAFRTQYNVPAAVRVVGPWVGGLDNGGDGIEISKPGTPVGIELPVIVVDRVDYRDTLPWPVEADGTGSSLAKVSDTIYGNDVLAWGVGPISGTPGRTNTFIDHTAPTAPSNLIATVPNTTSISLSWAAANDPESGIDHYNIYRDNVLIGTSPTSTYIDSTVAPSTVYSYQVSGVNPSALESPRTSAATAAVVIVTAYSAPLEDTIRLVFSEAVNEASAENVSRYTVSGGVLVLGATVQPDGLTVDLLTTRLTLATNYTVTAAGVVMQSARTLAPGASGVVQVSSGTRNDFEVRHVTKAGGQVRSITEANNLLALPNGNPGIASQQSGYYPTINFRDDDNIAGSGRFSNDLSFPDDHAGDDNDYAVRATTTVTIPANQGGNWTFATGIRGQLTSVVPAGSTWRYLDDGSDQGTAWQAAGFVDTTWSSGDAQFGYGDNDETTVLNFGPDPLMKHVTSYFRKTFTMSNVANVQSVTLRLMRDDGAAVYLNGTEIARQNLAAGALFSDLATATATGADETTFFEITGISPSLLVNGTNTIAVEVHQSTLDSSDVSFDAELLVGLEVAPPNPPPTSLVATGKVWKYRDTGENLGTAWRAVAYNDTAWATGASELGYGDGDEATIVGFGPDAANKYITTYFRTTFNVADPNLFANITGTLEFDDAAAMYINGVEVFRNGLSPDAPFNELGPNAVEPNIVPYSFDASVLVAGVNTIAVEVHQTTLGSSDISMDLVMNGIPGAFDDGVQLKIDGTTVINANLGTNPFDRFGTINLTPGDHTLELTYYERNLGSQLELFAAPGQLTTLTNAFQLVGNSAGGGLTVTTTGPPVNRAPRVIDVLAASSQWTPAFLAELQTQGLGTGGISLTTGASQLSSVRMANVNQIKVQFSDDMAVQESDLVLRGVNVADYVTSLGFAPGGFSYNAASRTATWTLNGSLGADKYVVELPHGAVQDTGGANLDGEWTQSTSQFSGDGVAGGKFEFRMNLVPGDVNASGTTNRTDLQDNLARQFTSLGGAGYTIVHDVDGNGAINIRDWALIRDRNGATLPAADPPLTGGSPEAPAAELATVEQTAARDAALESLDSTDGAPITLTAARRVAQVNRRSGSAVSTERPALPTTATRTRLASRGTQARRTASATDAALENV